MRTILIVDDQPIIREPIEIGLKKVGFRTMTAANGEEALDRLAEQEVDLILLDFNMPVMDGLATLQQLRHSPKWHNIPVLILTELTDVPKVERALTLGICGYLIKSQFSFNELVEQINKNFDLPIPHARDFLFRTQ